MIKYPLNIILILLLCCSISNSKSSPLEKDNYIIKQLKVKDGLSQSSILSILQDKKGFMWFGTSGGLNKFDGYSFKVYFNIPQDSSSISDNAITALYEDIEGYIWIGTTGGYVNRFDRRTEIFKRFNLNLLVKTPSQVTDSYYEYPLLYSRNSDNSVTTISEDIHGNIWIGTWGSGLFILDKKKEKFLTLRHIHDDPNSLSYDRVTKILSDKNGNIWIGTFGGGLNKLTLDTLNPLQSKKLAFDHYRNIPDVKTSLRDNKVTTLFEDNTGNLWIGTYYGGLNKLDYTLKEKSSDEAEFESYKSFDLNRIASGENSIMAITEDDSGYLWVGTFGGGLGRFDPIRRTIIFFKHDNLDENTIADNDIVSLCKDSAGIIWVGTHLGEGISRIEKKNIKFGKIQSYPAAGYSLNDDVVWSILKDDSGIFWIGTYRGGLNRYDERSNNFNYYKTDPSNPNSISNNHVRSLAEDKFGNLWVGTYAGGLNRFDRRSGKFHRYSNSVSNPYSISGNQIQKLYIDPNSIMWIAVFGGGLNVLDLKQLDLANPRFTKYRFNSEDLMSISDDRAYTIYEDKQNNLWIGTFGGGLNKFDRKSKKFERFRNDPLNASSLQNDKILCLYEDHSGNFWVGTSGSGLVQFDRKNKRFISHGSRVNIDAEVIYGILEDDLKNLWLSTSNGIYKYSYDKGIATHYDVQDGVQSLEFSGGAYFKTDNGEMFFGGINGVNRFFPGKVKNDEFIPPVVITSIKTANQSVKGEIDNLDLSYHENFITFEFAALAYSNPLNNGYSYKLDGFDEEWKFIDAKYRIANYTNLPPGEYVFKVKGANQDGVWNPNETNIFVSISPPYWKTWWFISIAILLISGGIYYLGSTHFRNELRIEKLKTKLAADLHDNIGSGLTEISILSEIAQKDFKSNATLNVQNKLNNISEVSRQLVDSMSDIVWVVNPKRDSLNDLLVRLKDSYSDILSSYGISFRIMDLDNLDHLSLPMEYRQNLYLIFKEAINNSIKHSNCKKMILEAHVQGNLLELTLTDDGTGLDTKNIIYGNGIRNMEARSKNLGGRLIWNSSSGNGTIVKFSGEINSTNRIKNFFPS